MPRRSTLQREQNLAELAKRYLQGEPQSAIALSMAVSQPQISYDLKELQRRWQASGTVDLDAAKGRELAKVDVLERTYWEAWERSCSERTITSTKKRGDDAAEATLRREKRDGNPAFLDGVLKCIERRCRIVGIDAPQKIAPTDPTGEWEYRSLTDADLNREVARILAAFADGAAGITAPGTRLSLAPPGEAEPATS